MRLAPVLLLGLTAAAAVAAPPPATLSGAPKLTPPWEQTTREI